MQQLRINNNDFFLHSSGAVYWENTSRLLISDVHLGKITHFRKHGMAVPMKAIESNYLLLQKAIDRFEPKEVIFLGDLFHSSLNQEWVLFKNFIEKNPISFILVTGNHDIIATEKFEALNIYLCDKLILQDFLFTHHPQEDKSLFNFAGHIHPAIRIKGLGKQSLKLPCFYRKNNQMILPAFGKFTGTHLMKNSTKADVFAIAEDMVIKI